MRLLATLAGLTLVLVVLWEAFESVVLPRRVTRRFRFARLFYVVTWRMWSAVGRRMRGSKRRENYLGYYGPLSLLTLFAMWAGLLMLAFAMLQWAIAPAAAPGVDPLSFQTALYFSGSTFITLGLGDVLPHSALARVATIAEAGMGFGFLAIVVAYLPTLYGAFSQRELNISLLDARAGSPPTAAELLRRHAPVADSSVLTAYLRDWEMWSGQLMESHLSYPALCYFRSQHDNQSWLAAFTAVLDVSSLMIAYGSGEAKWQAQLTFAISRHAVADLCEVLRIHAIPPVKDRLPPEDLPKVRELVLKCGVPCHSESADLKLRELCAMYEPYLNGLSARLLMPLPSWGVEPNFVDYWKRTAWSRISSPSD